MTEILKPLEKYLEPEKYPYEFGVIRGFALTLINGDTAAMIECFRSSSGGLGANSRALYSMALVELQSIPGLVESMEGQIPFPAYVVDQGVRKIEVQATPIEEILARISSYS